MLWCLNLIAGFPSQSTFTLFLELVSHLSLSMWLQHMCPLFVGLSSMLQCWGFTQVEEPYYVFFTHLGHSLLCRGTAAQLTDVELPSCRPSTRAPPWRALGSARSSRLLEHSIQPGLLFLFGAPAAQRRSRVRPGRAGRAAQEQGQTQPSHTSKGWSRLPFPASGSKDTRRTPLGCCSKGC